MVEVTLVNFSELQYARTEKPKQSRVMIRVNRMDSLSPDQIYNALDIPTVLIFLGTIGLTDYLKSLAWDELKKYLVRVYEKRESTASQTKKDMIKIEIDDERVKGSLVMEVSKLIDAQIAVEHSTQVDGSSVHRMLIQFKTKDPHD